MRYIFLILFSINSLASSVSAVEAAFVYRLMFFLPTLQKSDTYYICIKNDENIFEVMHKKLDGSRFGEGKLKIIQAIDNYKDCSLLFLGGDLNIKDVKHLSNDLKQQKILIVSKKGINKSLAMIILKTSDDKIKFDVNNTLMQSFKIQLSSKVLRLADEVF